MKDKETAMMSTTETTTETMDQPKKEGELINKNTSWGTAITGATTSIPSNSYFARFEAQNNNKQS